ncbi:putative bifunctional diguanylate cyclase/phosphodiesterase [Pseudomaricurvus sp.]|uniref:putative bifunctional diguanylate cyclase/phosphodiesterase n=1 Tax=Pseudomaricurvus sp. TaxID=2004510 RepID=UPI003F6C64F3
MNEPAPISSNPSSGQQPPPGKQDTRDRRARWPFTASLIAFILLSTVFSGLLWLQHRIQQADLKQLYSQKQVFQQHQLDHFTEQFRHTTLTAVQQFIDQQNPDLPNPLMLHNWWQQHRDQGFLSVTWDNGNHTSTAGDAAIMDQYQEWFGLPHKNGDIHSQVRCYSDECVELTKINVALQPRSSNATTEGNRSGQVRNGQLRNGQLRVVRDILQPLAINANLDTPGLADIKSSGLLLTKRRGEQSWQFQYLQLSQSENKQNDHAVESVSKLPLPLNRDLSLWTKIQKQPVITQEPNLMAPTRGSVWSLISFPNDYADNLYLLQHSEASPLAWQQHKSLLLLGLIYLGLSLIISFIIFTTIERFSQRLHRYASLLPLLGKKQYQQLREQLRQNQSKYGMGEFNEAESSLSALSYQLETQEKTVDIRTQEVERLSLFDPLTGLANRHLLQYEIQSDLEHLARSPRENLVAVILLDLDNFKRINDSLGHQLGDVLLEKMAKRLKGAIHSLGLVARLGGDEFAILLRSARRPEQLQALSQKIQDLVRKPLVVDNTSLVISCSIGVSTATLEDTPEDLVKHAEIAMYKAKQSGGNAHRLFNSQMAAEAHDNLSLESELRRGFEESEFTLYLQPKVNMDGIIKGFESLVRWDHPDRGTLPPSEFIPAMENMGFISLLDNWVLEASFRQLKVLEPHYPDIILAVNISSTHFTKESFLVFLHECLQKYPINPSRLELEITETLLMKNMSAGLEVIKKIKEMGVRIAIDDFGTGYSSLSYLKNLPVDTLKIDQEFIKDIPDSESDMQISSVIIFLAKQLHFSVVAEGVETAQQLSFLKANHCDLAQGYFFSKPIPAHKAILMLESERIDLANTRSRY